MKFIITIISAFMLITSYSNAQTVSTKKAKTEKTTVAEKNKAIVRRYNMEYIQGNDMNTFNELMADNFVNYTAPAGSPTDKSGVQYFFSNIMRPAFSDLTVEIHDIMADGDKVITRKTLHGVHTGVFFGVPATNKKISLDVIDIVQLKDGKYIGHWGILDIAGLMGQLK